MILEGRVSVNRVPVTVMGFQVDEKNDQVANALDLVTVFALNVVLVLFQNLAAVGVPPRFKLLFGHICRYIPRAL